MTSTIQEKGRTQSARQSSKSGSQRPATLKTTQTQRVSRVTISQPECQTRTTAIEQCVQNELRRYFDMLDGEEPANLYRMVVRQTEQAVISMVMAECRGNQTRASEWLGISRGNLRTKLANMDK